MKKAFILLAVFFIVLIVMGISIEQQESKKVLLAAELVGFEVEEELKVENGSIINTSSKQIGVVTYINPDTEQFVALGHSLTDCKEGKQIEGLCYKVELTENSSSLKKRAKLNEENPIGNVYYDSYCGIYGKMTHAVVQNYQEVETANRYSIKKGKANILIRLDGKNLETFEVEIISTNHLENNKNIRLKITDEKLLSQTGGIVQGMSGTPVMQNGKLIGAINAVNAKDSTDAYAVFIDKIL